jgi:phosphatidylserine/phosphatidylglycerophosphate/cardiolipin synthase-like enzyme
MATKAHFENIKEKIIEQLYSSAKSIKVAVAWFTDADLFEILCKKAKTGLRVELLLANDDINHNCSIDYEKLTSCGGKIYFVGEGTEFEPIMHHKFCIVDNYTLIFGSYNWTNKAKSNHENITIIDNDANIILDYNDEFERLRYYQSNKKEIHIKSKAIKLAPKSIDKSYEKNWKLSNEYGENARNDIRVVLKNKKIGLFDMGTQNEILDCQYEDIILYKDSHVFLFINNGIILYDFLNRKEIELLPSKYRSCLNF